MIINVGRSLAVVGVALLVLAGDSPAQDADAKEVAAYRFTEATFAKYLRASRALAALAKTMPVDTSGEAREEEDEGDSESGTKSIAEITAGYDSVPGARRAITSAGLTTREFVVFSFALLQAGMAAAVVEQVGWDKLPPDIARSNVEFFQRHRATLDSAAAELKPRQ